VAVLLCTIPLNKGFSRHAQAAIDLYNKGDDGTARLKPSLHLIPYTTGAKLILRF
jgi:hypothetical protein